MPQSFRLKRFTNVAVLKRIDFGLLKRFFESSDSFRQFLSNRGLSWACSSEEFDYDRLAEILMSPNTNTPEELLDALYFVDGMANEECCERIQAECEKAGINLGCDDMTFEDLTLHVWLADRRILERVHAEQYRVQPRKFLSYFASSTKRTLQYPSSDTLVALQDDMNEWYDFRKKGRGSKVFPFFKDDGAWFLVRHGEHIKRESTLEEGDKSGSVFYRPEKFDVLIYYEDTGELAICTHTKGELRAYCTFFGRHLFGYDEYFRFVDPDAKYSLEPLIDNCSDSLVCSDIDDIEHIRLCELHIQHGCDGINLEIRRAYDVLKALAQEDRSVACDRESSTLCRAKFKVAFTGGKERTVIIEPPNSASFDRESDNAAVHQWLSKRGFICRGDNCT